MRIVVPAWARVRIMISLSGPLNCIHGFNDLTPQPPARASLGYNNHMARTLDPFDQRLLDVLQTAVPLTPRPFAEIARTLAVSEEDVLARIRALRTPPAVIRQISAIFDSKALGYQSTLVAARVDPAHIDAAAAVINAHPGVSHNYQRNHAFNLWYTLAVPPDSGLGLEKTLDILHRTSGAISTRMMPTLRLFKIGVKFDLSGEADIDARTTSTGYTQAQRDVAEAMVLIAADKTLIRVLQQDLPAEPEPFAAWAAQAGVSVAELLAAAQRFIEGRLMRRFSAVLRHREAGISSNAMGVWAVPPEQQEAFGTTAAGFAAVSHCYLRRSYPDWPYTMFTMVHAPTPEKCQAVLAAIAQATGVKDYGALFSTKEYKKVRVKYFTGDVEAWERGSQSSL